MKFFYKNLSIWLVVCLVGLLFFNIFKRPPLNYHYVRYNEFLEKINSGLLSDVTIKENTITWADADNNKYQTIIPASSPALDKVLNKDIHL